MTQAADETLLAELTNPDAIRPADIRPCESLIVRLLVVLFAPMWGAIFGAALLWRLLRNRRPVLIFHERVGYQRSPLWVPKIATTSIASNQQRYGGLIEVATGPPAELVVADRFEHWLRHSGVDELPQLSLVIRGKMRLVGPRPVTPDELAQMADGGAEVGVDIVQPGLVGLWQVLDRHRYELGERRELDLLMINNWSPWLRRRILTIALRQGVHRLRSI